MSLGMLLQNKLPELPAPASDSVNGHVVVLTNYLRELHVDVLSELQRRVKRLTVLLSTPMEADRNWQPEWKDLNVRVQKTWTLVRKWRHSSGFQEANFVHLPYDTMAQLQQLAPDVVLSFELGLRTFLSSRYCRKRKVPLVAVGNMSERIERERGWLRRRARDYLVPRIDYFTYNGPSCRRYFESLGIPDPKLFPFPYFYDTSKVFRGPKLFSTDFPRKLLFSGNLNPRKGIRPLIGALVDWAQRHPHRPLELRVCGTGTDRTWLERSWPANLQVDARGHCSSQSLAEAYGWADLCLFPTLADEWGLVPIEAFASGLPVVGSLAAQSLEVYGMEGRNGWYYEPSQAGGLERSLATALATPAGDLQVLSQVCRETVRGITANHCAGCLETVIRTALNLPQPTIAGSRKAARAVEPRSTGCTAGTETHQHFD